MQKQLVHQNVIKLIGLKVRTNSHNEMNPEVSRIGQIVGKFYQENIAAEIPLRTQPNIIKRFSGQKKLSGGF